MKTSSIGTPDRSDAMTRKQIRCMQKEQADAWAGKRSGQPCVVTSHRSTHRRHLVTPEPGSGQQLSAFAFD